MVAKDVSSRSLQPCEDSPDRDALGTAITFGALWAEQRAFNDAVKSTVTDPVDWPINFVLGIHSETDELLREMHWRHHRKDGGHDKPNKENIAEELADITKYVLCLWQEFDFTETQALRYIGIKNQIMQQRWNQEFLPPPDPNRLVVICDLDGTLADYRVGLLNYLVAQHGFDAYAANNDQEKSLHMDADLKIPYELFRSWKTEFENGGGYRDLPVYGSSILFVAELVNRFGAYLIVTTARPTAIKRIWYDTWLWLRACRIVPDQLLFTESDRIIASMFEKKGMQPCLKQKVLLLEDNPEIVLRAASTMPVLVKEHRYNLHLKESDPNIQVVSHFEVSQLKGWNLL